MKETIQLLEEAVKGGVSDRHSYYQLKYFLVDGEPTHQARLWQCMREMKSRLDTVKSIFLEMEDAKDRLAIHDARAELAAEKAELRGRDDPKAPEARILFAKARIAERRAIACERRLADLGKRLRNVSEEARFLLEMLNRLGGKDAMKDWDDPEVQKEYWDAKVGDEIRRRLVAGQGLDASLVGTVERLHKDAKVRGVINAYARAMLAPPQEGKALPDRGFRLLDAPAEQKVGGDHREDDLEDLDASRLHAVGPVS